VVQVGYFSTACFPLDTQYEFIKIVVNGQTTTSICILQGSVTTELR